MNGNKIVFHVTRTTSLDSIAEHGLLPTASHGSIGGAVYAFHTEDRVFFSAPEGVRYWFDKAWEWADHESDNPVEDGLTPVVLRAQITASWLQPDDLGTKDSSAPAFYVERRTVQPWRIEAWTGERWERLGWGPSPEALAWMSVTVEKDADTGEEIGWRNQKDPLLPKGEQLSAGLVTKPKRKSTKKAER